MKLLRYRTQKFNVKMNLTKIKDFLLNLKATEEQISSNILQKHNGDILLNASR